MVAWVVLGLTLVLTIGLWRYSTTEFTRRANENFKTATEKQTDRLVERMQDYEQVLRGSAALFAASDSVSRQEWRTYIAMLQLDRSLPGIQGTGFALMVPKSARRAHERRVRMEGFPAYTIHPAGDRALYSSIVYLEPFSGRNVLAFGYDMYSDPVRREAMERARDSGEPEMSAKVTLVQEAGQHEQAGFLIYLPVYRHDMPHHTVAARRRALLGFVYSPFRVTDLMNNVLNDPGRELEVELFDDQSTPDNLLFASTGSARTARYVSDHVLSIAGRRWIARFKSNPVFESRTKSAQPLMILLGGLAFGMLLFSVLYMNARHRRAMHDATAKLEASLDSFRALVENVPGAVFRVELGSSSPVQQLSQGIHTLTGEPPERFVSGEVSYVELIHADDRPMVSQAISKAIATRGIYNIEYRIRTTEGRLRWVSERGRVTSGLETGRARWLDGLILDVSERKAAEIMIHDLAYNDPLTDLPNRRLLMDRIEHQLATSSRSGRYGALLFIDMDHFKTINDTFGHEAGDQVLKEVARRLLANVRESDTVARLGGDEFVVLLDSLGDTVDAAAVEAGELGNKILDKLARPYRVDAHLCTSTPSIGVVMFCGHAESTDQLLKRADEAMYQAKSAGRNRISFHSEFAATATGSG
ncbi:CHASE domain-containing protein [Thiobacillus sp.]